MAAGVAALLQREPMLTSPAVHVLPQLLQPGNVKGTAAGANDTQVTFRHLLCHIMRHLPLV